MEQYNEVVAMLTVIYKQLDDLERKQKGSTRMASIQTYLDELRQKAAKISVK